MIINFNNKLYELISSKYLPKTHISLNSLKDIKSITFKELISH